MRIKNRIVPVMLILLLIAAVFVGCEQKLPAPSKGGKISRFSSDNELVKAFEEVKERNRPGFWENVIGIVSQSGVMSAGTKVVESAPAPSERAYSETNIQVEGVDEADIIKTDGSYIYTLSNNKLIIAKAYPADEAEILSKTALGDFYPTELFIHQNRLLLFGSSSYYFSEETGVQNKLMGVQSEIDYYPRYSSFVSVKLYDASDKNNPRLLRTLDFEGNYLTSRKIGPDAYFVVNSYPFYERLVCADIVPLYRESSGSGKPEQEDMQPIAKCTDIGYIEPIQANNFITIASISMTDENKDVEKEVIVGSGQNVYASLSNLYVAQTSWPVYNAIGQLKEEYVEKTVITKFSLDEGNVNFAGSGEVNGYILNQFSMDEYDSHFRIATTTGQVWGGSSANHLYVLDEDLEVVGALEDLAPGEKIYSVRFMGKKGYVVTFKKVDPLFVIDLSDHTNPTVLGKLKIPGYSDYMHPYDETHIIGIGKETVEAEESLKEGRGLDFAWYQGVKMAIFDVSDVENPIEMHKVVIGDRGTDSEVLSDHKAFLFDKDKNLLVLPITLAEIKGEKTSADQYGEYTFQGAYVYDITLEDGFELRGRVTHYDDDEVFKKSGYYFIGTSAIKRSLYIEDVLYTLSNTRLQLNDLNDLQRLKALDFNEAQT